MTRSYPAAAILPPPDVVRAEDVRRCPHGPSVAAVAWRRDGRHYVRFGCRACYTATVRELTDNPPDLGAYYIERSAA